MDIHWRVRVEEVHTGFGSDTDRLTNPMRWNQNEISRVDLHRLLALDFKIERAADHHHVFVWCVPMPRDRAAGSKFLNEDRSWFGRVAGFKPVDVATSAAQCFCEDVNGGRRRRCLRATAYR